MALLSDYDYDLPESSIAQEPLDDRAASRLLWLHRSRQIEHRTFRDVPEILQPGDLLVMNDTRVTALRFFGQKRTGAKVEILLLKRLPDGSFEVLAKPACRLPAGARVVLNNGLDFVVEMESGYGVRIIRFLEDSRLDERLQSGGLTPLPPYIHSRLRDPERYQTVYASAPGSSAAPTAGLHFTRDLLDALSAKGVSLANVTLDVGFDTFRPVNSEDLSEHKMHGERCVVPEDTANAIEACQGRVIAVGTTTVRTLESFAVGKKRIEPGAKTTSIFIRPGFQFQIIDGMFTNFHMPRTTMLMMLAAFVGRDLVFSAYREALARGYRFLSFGDSMLIL